MFCIVFFVFLGKPGPRPLPPGPRPGPQKPLIGRRKCKIVFKATLLC